MAAEVGQAAPDFTLYDTDRQQRSLSEFAGKNVVLAFFPAPLPAFAPPRLAPCGTRWTSLTRWTPRWWASPLTRPFPQKKWADDNNVNYPFLSDFNRQAVNAYDVALPNLAGMEGYVAANRAVVIVDKEGVIRYRWVAPSPATEPDYDAVQAALSELA